MFSRFSRVAGLSSLACVFAVGVILAIGCQTGSPFLAAAFNSSLVGVNTGGPPPTPPTPDDPTEDDNVTSVCDLLPAEQTLQIAVQNESQQFVEFSMTLVVSAGPGGFVCDELLNDYLNAGYTDAIVPGSGTTTSIGCDTVGLLSGTRLLTLEFGINQGAGAMLAPNATGDANTIFPDPSLPQFTLRRRDNGSALIPLPELVVFGNDDPDFICTGGVIVGDLCTQRGFVYTSGVGLPVGKSIEASRIQGTVCAENFGSAPEWRLDKTLDAQVQPFQYGRGGVIVVGVLDRAGDALDNTRNQAAWLVVDAADNTLHFPDR